MASKQTRNRSWTLAASSDEDCRPSSPKRARWGSTGSSDEGQSGRTRPRRWLHASSSSSSEDACQVATQGTKRNWQQASGSSSDSEDVWKRRRGAEASGSKSSGVHDSGPQPALWGLSDDDQQSSDDPASRQAQSSIVRVSRRAQSSGVPASGRGKPVVNLTLEALHLKAASMHVRKHLTHVEQWGLNEQRVRKVLREPACSCTKACYKQLSFEQLSGLCRWFHGNLTHSERQYVIYTLYQAATNPDGAELQEDAVQARVQWQLQGSSSIGLECFVYCIAMRIPPNQS